MGHAYKAMFLAVDGKKWLLARYEEDDPAKEEIKKAVEKAIFEI